MTKKVLFAGESWFIYSTHVKGFDSFNTTTYESAETNLKLALEADDFEVDYMPNHIAGEKFPYEMSELEQYDCIILSDIGANTLLLPNPTFSKSEYKPNRCNLIRDYVLAGGSLLMVGGYMTFSGIEAKGKWQDTAIQDVLPVQVLNRDDRMEHGEGIYPKTIQQNHPILAGLGEWPPILGYNQTILKDEAQLLAEVLGDPFIAVGEYGKGRSAAFTTDCAPHWAPPEFCDWESYDLLFQNIVNWLIKKL